MLPILSALLLVLLFDSADAQIASCTEVGCPADLPYVRCALDNQPFLAIGVTNLTTTLSQDPLTWTVGHKFREPSGDDHMNPNLRVFYLGQPSSLNLRDDDSITMCALFFNGIASKLNFNNSAAASDVSRLRGTCEDALTTSCVSDWTQQAQILAKYSNAANFTCDRLAENLRANPPKSCKVAKGSWGKVTARPISGLNMSRPVTDDECHMTMYQGYSQTKISTFNLTDDSVSKDITPVLTVMRPVDPSKGLASEVHLACLKPVFDDDGPGEGFQGAAISHRVDPAIALLSSIVLVLFLSI